MLCERGAKATSGTADAPSVKNADTAPEKGYGAGMNGLPHAIHVAAANVGVR
jgi:hypothetical protein